MGGLNNRTLFLTVLEARKSTNKVPADLVSGEGPLPGSQTPPLLTVSSQGRGGRALWIPFMRALTPLMRTPPSWPNHLTPLPHLLIPSNWEFGFNIWIRRNINIQSIAFLHPVSTFTQCFSLQCISSAPFPCPTSAAQHDPYNLKDILPTSALSPW